MAVLSQGPGQYIDHDLEFWSFANNYYQGRATVFIGNANARTFDFSAGDTGVFPDNSGMYLTSPRERAQGTRLTV